MGVKEFAATVRMASPNVLRAISPHHNPRPTSGRARPINPRSHEPAAVLLLATLVHTRGGEHATLPRRAGDLRRRGMSDSGPLSGSRSACSWPWLRWSTWDIGSDGACRSPARTPTRACRPSKGRSSRCSGSCSPSRSRARCRGSTPASRLDAVTARVASLRNIQVCDGGFRYFSCSDSTTLSPEPPLCRPITKRTVFRPQEIASSLRSTRGARRVCVASVQLVTPSRLTPDTTP